MEAALAAVADGGSVPFFWALIPLLLFQVGVAAWVEKAFWAALRPLLALAAAAPRAIEAAAAAVASPAWVSPLTMRRDRGTFSGGSRLQIWVMNKQKRGLLS